jgi:hypothetical protein
MSSTTYHLLTLQEQILPRLALGHGGVNCYP